MPDPTPPDLDALRELAEQRLDPNGPCWNEFQRAECSERLARALLAALDVVDAAERVDNDFAGFGKGIARCSRESAQALRAALIQGGYR